MQTKFDIGQRVFFEMSGVAIIGTAEILAIDIRAPYGVRYNLYGIMYLEATVYSDPDTCASALIRAAATVFEEREGAIRVRMNELKQQYPPETVQLGSFS